MKDKLVGIISLANAIEVKGGDNLLNLYKIIALTQSILNDIESLEKQQKEAPNETT